jgi:hypothetical protein
MPEEQLVGMTLQTPRSDQKPERGHLGVMIAISAIIMLLVALVWIYFSPWIEN